MHTRLQPAMPLPSSRILLLLAAIAIAAPRGASGETVGSDRRCRLEVGRSMLGLVGEGLATIDRCYAKGKQGCADLDRTTGRTRYTLSAARGLGTTGY